MKYVIPIKSREDIEFVSDTLTSLGYEGDEPWNSHRMRAGAVNDCIYIFESNLFSIHRHEGGYLRGYKVVSIDGIESTIKPL